jgi:2,3-bisphosphoglycerate-dependent phosphoglycerate mutase
MAEITGVMRRIEEVFLHGVPGVTEIWLIRHGDCYEGLADITAPDPPLSDFGRRRAAALAGRVAGAGIAAVYSSKSRRAVETASALGLPVATDDRFREIQNDPAAAVQFVMNRYQSFSETPESVVARMTEAIDELIERHPGQRVAVVSHGVAMLCYLASLLRLEFTQLRLLPYYTSISVIRGLEERRMVGSLVDATHVADVRP